MVVVVFGQFDLDIIDWLGMMVGVWYSYDKKDVIYNIDVSVVVFGIGDFMLSDDQSWEFFDLIVSVYYDLFDDVMVYVLFSIGYKVGVF